MLGVLACVWCHTRNRTKTARAPERRRRRASPRRRRATSWQPMLTKLAGRAPEAILSNSWASAALVLGPTQRVAPNASALFCLSCLRLLSGAPFLVTKGDACVHLMRARDMLFWSPKIVMSTASPPLSPFLCLFPLHTSVALRLTSTLSVLH